MPGKGQGEDLAPLDGAVEARQVAQATLWPAGRNGAPRRPCPRMNSLEVFAPLSQNVLFRCLASGW